MLKRLRTVCLALPETSERLSHGAPSFFVRDKKCFLMLLDACPARVASDVAAYHAICVIALEG